MGWFRKLLALGVSLFVVGGDARALTVDFDHEFESSSDESAVRRWSDDALAQLPPTFHQRFPGTIRVRFRSWGNGAQLPVPYCSGDTPEDRAPRTSLFETYGRYNTVRNIIYLNSQLIDEIRLGPQGTRGFDCYHGNFYRLATATLLHEIAHAYDNLDLDASIGKSDKRSRRSQATISTDPAWTVVDGFHTRLFGFRYPTAKNRDRNRLPSAHAARNKRESFAVHFEYFLLDPDYACRFPSHQEYFENHFGWSPARKDCRLNYEVGGTRESHRKPTRAFYVALRNVRPGHGDWTRVPGAGRAAHCVGFRGPYR